MLKKVITTVLSLCLIFNISVMTVGAVGEVQQGDMPQMGQMPSEGFAPPEGFTPPQSGESGSVQTTDPKTNTDLTEEEQTVGENTEKSEQTQGGNSPFGGGIPGGMGGFSGNMQSGQNTEVQQPAGFLGFVKTYSTPITSVVLLGLAFIFVIFYKRKNY